LELPERDQTLDFGLKGTQHSTRVLQHVYELRAMNHEAALALALMVLEDLDFLTDLPLGLAHEQPRVILRSSM